MLITQVGVVFYSSNWSRKILDYKYGREIPYLARKFEIFLHLWSEKFSMEILYKKKLVHFGMELSIYSSDKTRLWRHNNMVHYVLWIWCKDASWLSKYQTILMSVLEFLLIAPAHLTTHDHTNSSKHIWYPEHWRSSSLMLISLPMTILILPNTFDILSVDAQA